MKGFLLEGTVSNLSRIDFYKTDHLVGAKLFWGSYRL